MKNTFLLLLTIINLSKQDLHHWKVEELFNTIEVNDSKKNYIVDPNNYISTSTKDLIFKKMESISSERDFDNILIILNTINEEYNKDITKFSELLMFDLFNKTTRNKTILVIYSIEDRIYRIRTGSIAREAFTDKSTENLAEYIKTDLKNQDYDDAFLKLYDNMDKCIKGVEHGCEPNYLANRIFWYIFLSILVIFGICCVYSYYQNKKKQAIQSVLREKFQTIKELKESKPDAVLFIQENCVICLEELKKENGELQKGNPLREVVLKCGHNFHDGCIKDWLKSKEKCPICRENAFYEEENVVRSQRPLIENRQNGNMNNNLINGVGLTDFLYEIQRDRYEQDFNRRQMDDMYYNNTWSWATYDKDHGTSSGNRGFSVDKGAGGTTGGW